MVRDCEIICEIDRDCYLECVSIISPTPKVYINLPISTTPSLTTIIMKNGQTSTPISIYSVESNNKVLIYSIIAAAIIFTALVGFLFKPFKVGIFLV